MRHLLDELKEFCKKGDIVLLTLCWVVAGFGLIIIASATQAPKFGGNLRYITVQTVSIVLGTIMYVIFSSVDLELLSEYRLGMVVFNCFLLIMLLSPLGTDNDSGNRSWIDLGIINVQPAEICKITYILIMASIMSSHQNRISHPASVMHMLFHLFLLVGLNLVVSSDMGVSLIFVFIFIGMAFTGGVSLWWFAAAIGGISVMAPILFNFLDPYQQNRIRILYDPSIDPQGINERFHSIMNLRSLTGGGMTGQGLFNGNRTSEGVLFAQHTDYIFSAIGEELGFLGCIVVMLMELALIARCIYVGIRCRDYMRSLVCFGAASSLMFQVLINVGMCIGVMPVIGLTLPLVSYGGSSVVTTFSMLGLVSGAYARPQSMSYERYVQPYRG